MRHGSETETVTEMKKYRKTREDSSRRKKKYENGMLRIRRESVKTILFGDTTFAKLCQSSLIDSTRVRWTTHDVADQQRS